MPGPLVVGRNERFLALLKGSAFSDPKTAGENFFIFFPKNA